MASDLEAGPGAGRRQHRRHQARRTDATGHHPLCRTRQRDPAARRAERCARNRWDHRRRTGPPPGCRPGVLHRLDRGGPTHRPGSRRSAQATGAGTGRQRAGHHLRRRRPGGRVAHPDQRRAFQRRAGMHVLDPDAGQREDPRPVRRGDGRQPGCRQGRRCVRCVDGARTPDLADPAGTASRTWSTAGPTALGSSPAGMSSTDPASSTNPPSSRAWSRATTSFSRRSSGPWPPCRPSPTRPTR